MRFLKIGPHSELTLSKDLRTPPGPYAILSHTWGAEDDEVNFDDFEKEAGQEKAGYIKLRFCAEQARADELEYFWVDTCCINKANTAELNEAITSMFRWYSEAAKCYVLLCDVSSHKRTLLGTGTPWQSMLRTSRWFTRGWTLQELLAPRQVEFYSREGDRLGDKNSLRHEIHKISHIPIEALQGAPLSDFKVEQRLQWASGRNTTREEDQAYCLTGIFGVYMLPNYGEGSNAF
ncbi:hypothetical protein GJ744_011838 [Endocarpon pusillum]|uniref:Heterokaryon incompatibility domain-containing protein n=1 Tax=Endocarpon pusillum TaxID=364733 RepID=A0A8H7AEK4_9EURO|nr:hypothetical protein GJ744_011838 [Endocarpon pusillum]